MIAVFEKTPSGYELFAAGFRSPAHAMRAMQAHRPMRYRLVRYDGRSVRYAHRSGRLAVVERLARAVEE